MNAFVIAKTCPLWSPKPQIAIVGFVYLTTLPCLSQFQLIVTTTTTSDSTCHSIQNYLLKLNLKLCIWNLPQWHTTVIHKGLDNFQRSARCFILYSFPQSFNSLIFQCSEPFSSAHAANFIRTAGYEKQIFWPFLHSCWVWGTIPSCSSPSLLDRIFFRCALIIWKLLLPFSPS